MKILGIIILNYNSYDQTLECVESILNTTNIDFKIYIVDNNSSDKSGEKLALKFKEINNIDIILSEVNGGYSAGNNIGIKRAINEKSDVILISNSDIVFQKNTINKLVDFFNKEKNASVVAPKILDNNGTNSTAYFRDITFKDYFINKILPKRLMIRREKVLANLEYKDDYIEFQGMPSGSCFAITSDLLKDLDYLDENVFLYYEETIMASKLKERNRKSIILKEVTAIHKHVYSHENYQSPLGAISVCHSLLYYLTFYKNINKAQFYLIFIPHFMRFYTRSKNNKEYKRYLNIFKIKCLSLLEDNINNNN